MLSLAGIAGSGRAKLKIKKYEVIHAETPRKGTPRKAWQLQSQSDCHCEGLPYKAGEGGSPPQEKCSGNPQQQN